MFYLVIFKLTFFSENFHRINRDIHSNFIVSNVSFLYSMNFSFSNGPNCQKRRSLQIRDALHVYTFNLLDLSNAVFNRATFAAFDGQIQVVFIQHKRKSFIHSSTNNKCKFLKLSSFLFDTVVTTFFIPYPIFPVLGGCTLGLLKPLNAFASVFGWVFIVFLEQKFFQEKVVFLVEFKHSAWRERSSIVLREFIPSFVHLQ